MTNLPKSFYPTPKALIDEMLTGVDFNRIQSVLEPSAGKGDLAKACIARNEAACWRGVQELDLDCVEIDANFRHILKGEGLRVVADDFLRFHTSKNYDPIIANPPFEEGDRHLLRMLEMQKRGGGVICLLNAETLRNPYSNIRKALAQELDRLEADIEYISGAFSTAERKTDVDVALVRVSIPTEAKSFIFEDLKAAAARRESEEAEQTALADCDVVKQIAAEYATAAEAMERLFREYWALRPYLKSDLERGDCIVELALHGHSRGHGVYESAQINDALPALRKRYWKMLFAHPAFSGRLTSNLRNELNESVEAMGQFDANEYNIRTLQLEMSQKTLKGLEDTILALFDQLSHANYYDEGSKNIHYFSGWKTNKCWKINKKVIQPIPAFEEWRGSYTYYPGRCVSTLTDIEKVFTYLDSTQRERVDIEAAMKDAREGRYTTVELTYFDVTFYKKGTCHIVFTDLELLGKFNLYGSQRKGWLPPSYGKKRYEDMTRDEQVVVDSYQGKAEYEKILQNPEYYIVEPSGLLQLAGR